jgi:hypothetical protein
MKIVVGSLDLDAVLAVAGVIADVDSGLGIQGEAQNRGIGIGFGVDLAQSIKDGVGLGDLFFGKLFLTFLGWYPSWLSFSPIVSASGN